MDMTVAGIGAVVVAELRAAGYMESTVGQYLKSIKALTEFASGREYSAGLGAEFASMTTSVRTGRFSAQRRFDYRRLVAVLTRMCAPAGWSCRIVAAAAGVHGPRAAASLRWTPLGRPRWTGAVWHRPPARPTGGWRVATWCSWRDAGSPCLTGLMAPVPVRGQVQCRLAGGSGEAGGHGDQVAAQGGAARDGVVAAGDGRGGAQQVMRAHRAVQPGTVGGEQPGDAPAGRR